MPVGHASQERQARFLVFAHQPGPEKYQSSPMFPAPQGRVSPPHSKGKDEVWRARSARQTSSQKGGGAPQAVGAASETSGMTHVFSDFWNAPGTNMMLCCMKTIFRRKGNDRYAIVPAIPLSEGGTSDGGAGCAVKRERSGSAIRAVPCTVKAWF